MELRNLSDVQLFIESPTQATLFGRKANGDFEPVLQVRQQSNGKFAVLLFDPSNTEFWDIAAEEQTIPANNLRILS